MPLGTRHATGVIWAVREGRGDNLKSVASVRDWLPLRQQLRDFIDWVARWTLSPAAWCCAWRSARTKTWGNPAEVWGRGDRQIARTHNAGSRTRHGGSRRAEAPIPKSALAERAKCSTGVIDGLVEDGALASVALPPDRAASALDPDFSVARLNADQHPAAADLVQRVAERGFSSTLLEGVTGSGKTEVYSRGDR